MAVLDLGTNTTRLLVADVVDGRVLEVDRRTEITRLGEGVDATGRLAPAAIARVYETVGGYRRAIDELDVDLSVALATSAVREAADGPSFLEGLRERFRIEARAISGEEEARLTFLGATAARRAGGEAILVLDIGGGSTELVVGAPGGTPSFHASTPAGSVRQTERHLAEDPPPPGLVERLRTEVRGIIEEAVPYEVRSGVGAGIAVAGTATSLAAIDQELEPYDPTRVHGYVLPLARSEQILARLAALPLEERRLVTGLHPGRAPTIVAGASILVEAMAGFGLEAIEVSEADILHGAALTAATAGA